MRLFSNHSDLMETMQSLVNVINETGDVDVFSFDTGKAFGSAWSFDFESMTEPHVPFRCDRDYAEIFNRLLSIAVYDGKLACGWYVTAFHNASGELIYRLISTPPFSMIGRIHRKVTGPAPLIRDVHVLSNLFSKAAKIKAGKIPLPEVHRLCVSDELEAWRSVPPDPRIQHLVNTLNATGAIHTFGSCQGHFTRGRNPYVAFHATGKVASIVWRTICALHDEKALYHDWMISGGFDWQSRLVFSIQSKRLQHDAGVLTAFFHYVVKRERIDKDFQLLAESIKNSLKQSGNRIENARVLEPDEQQCTSGHSCPQQPILNTGLDFLTANIPDWIGVCASRTCSHRIRSNLVRACFALFQSKRHIAFLSSFVWFLRPKTSFIREAIFSLAKPFRKPLIIHINTPVIVHIDDTPEAMRVPLSSSQTVLLPLGHRLTGSHLANPDKRRVVPVQPMEVE